LIHWSGIHRFAEASDDFVVQATETIPHVIPKRAFTPEQVDVVRAMLAERIKSRPRPGRDRRILVRAALLWLLLIVAFFVSRWALSQ
jgi:hypothetical protein